MKNLFFSVFLIPVLVASAQLPVNETANLIKQHKIVSMTGSTVVFQNGVINTEQSKNFLTIFNENGLPVENRYLDIKGGSITVYKYGYGRCPEYEKWEWLNYGDDGIDTVQVQTVVFDNNCRSKKIIWTDSSGEMTEFRNLDYDNKGRLIKSVDMTPKKVMTAYVMYSYPDSLITDTKGYYGDSSFWYHHREYFDKRGNTTKVASYNEKGIESKDEGRTEYIYVDNLLKESVVYDGFEKEVSRTTYFYNTQGLLEKTIFVYPLEDTETISTYRYTKSH